MSGKWSEPGVPHRGWTCIGIDDVGEPSHMCEMCESQMVRYVHTMEHPAYPEALDVGCVCAGKMEEDYARARLRERTFKKRVARRARWLRREWRVSASGNEYINADGFNIVVFPRGRGWSARITHRETDDQQFLQERCETAEQAKLSALDVMLDMKGG
jgi:hypothetical protein